MRLNLGYLLRALNRTPHKAALRSDLSVRDGQINKNNF